MLKLGFPSCYQLLDLRFPPPPPAGTPSPCLYSPYSSPPLPHEGDLTSRPSQAALA